VGQLLFMEGDTGREMYILKSGKIKILKQEGDSSLVLATLGAGSVLGEMSLLDNAPRSATAQIVEDTAVTVIDEKVLAATYQKIPSWLVSVIKIVVKRLRETIQKNGKDLIQNNMGGVVEILLILSQTDYQSPSAIPLKEIKSKGLQIIGLSGGDTDKILNELILKEMVRISKNEKGGEMVNILDPAVLSLYAEFLLGKTTHSPLPGERLSDPGAQLLNVLLDISQDSGRKKEGDYTLVTKPVVEIEMQRRGLGRTVDPEALENLVDNNFIKNMEKTTSTGRIHHKNFTLGINPAFAQEVLITKEWLPVFQADQEGT